MGKLVLFCQLICHGLSSIFLYNLDHEYKLDGGVY